MKQLDEKLTPNTVAAPRHSYRLSTTSNSQWACGALQKHEMTHTDNTDEEEKNCGFNFNFIRANVCDQ